jgi:hypothetical protein
MLVCSLAIATSAGMSHAQSFNIDFGPANSSVPSVSYGGAANQTGVWNSVNKILSNLVAVDGSATFVSIAGNRMTTVSIGFDGASTDDAALMEDLGFGNAMDAGANYQITGLAIGWYDVYVHAWAGFAPGYTESKVAAGESSSGFGTLIHTHFAPQWPGRHVAGETYGKFTLQITDTDSNLSFGLIPLGGELDPVSVINGLQIVQIPAPAVCTMLAGFSISAMRRRR